MSSQFVAIIAIRYYRNCVHDYYTKATSLYDLTRVPRKGRVKFVFTSECDKHFDALKGDGLTEALILGVWTLANKYSIVTHL